MFKRIALSAIAVCFIVFAACPVTALPSVSAHAAVVLDAVSGEILFAQNADEVLPMASTTKIMTALLAFESGLAEEPVEITEEMVAVEGSSMGLKAGDVIALGEIARGMMMASGNDGANAIALFLGSTAEGFSAMMNEKAAALGMNHTQFVTPSGLDADGHGSTACDMALLGAAAMECTAFAETVGASSLEVTFISPEKTVRYENHNRLLQLYDGCTGIKTGFTKKAGRCLVSAAARDGARLICVTLNAPDDWNDHIALFDYGFSQLTLREMPEAEAALPVVGGVASAVRCTAGETVSRLLPENVEISTAYYLPRFLYAPVRHGDALGSAVYTINEKEIACVPLLAAEDVAQAADTRGEFEKWWNRFFG